MKKILLLLIAVCFILTGCYNGNNAISPQSDGAIKLAISKSELTAKTIQPTLEMTIASFDIRGTGPNGTSFERIGIPESSIIISNLAVGNWTISVDARNAGGTIIAAGVTTVMVAAGITANAGVTVQPLSGTGALRVTVSWPEGLIANPSVTGVLTPQDETSDSINFTLAANHLSATYENSSLNAGYYTLLVQLKDGATVKWGAIESVRIIAGQTAEGGFPLTSTPGQNGEVTLVITPDLQNPIQITFSGQEEQLDSGTDMTITASTNPSPVDSYQWYLNGALLSGNTGASITLGKSLGEGSYRLDLVVTKDNIVSTGSICFTVISSVVKNLNTGLTYPTIQAAIDAASAGDTISVRGGTYKEHLTITKNNLTIQGEDLNTTIIDGSGSGTVVYLGNASNVSISQFTITNGEKGIHLNASSQNQVNYCKITQNAGFGIQIYPVSSSNTVKNCQIYNNTSDGVNMGDFQGQRNNIIENNKVFSNSGAGIIGYITTDGARVAGNEVYSNTGGGIICGWSTWIIESNTVYSNGNYGIALDTASNCQIRNNNVFNNNGDGIFDWGIGQSSNTIENNIINNNSGRGLTLNCYARNDVIRHNVVSNNGIGFQMESGSPGGNNHIYSNNFINNLTQVSYDNSSSGNSWDDAGRGNYWSDYTGSDLNGDGIGDTPYLIPGSAGSKDNYPLMTEINL
jgi:parallel beta-helix repeat protein